MACNNGELLDQIILSSGKTSWRRRKISRDASAGVIKRLANGVYFPADVYADLPFHQREFLRHLAAGMARRSAVLTGRSAALVHGIPSADTRKSWPVALTPLSELRVGSQPIYRDYGMFRATLPLKTAIDLARLVGVEEGVVALDHVLKNNGATIPDLQDMLHEHRRCRGVSNARAAARLATDVSESPRESMLKYRMFIAGLPAPLQQAEIHGPNGFIARPDFIFDDALLVVEYDGAGKFQGLYGTRPEVAALRHMLRQQELIDGGFHLVHSNSDRFRLGVDIDDIVYVHRQLKQVGLQLRPRYSIRGGVRAWR